MKFKWEIISDGMLGDTMRAKIHGGWIVKHNLFGEESEEGGFSVATSMVFIPDPHHCWRIDNVD